VLVKSATPISDDEMAESGQQNDQIGDAVKKFVGQIHKREHTAEQFITNLNRTLTWTFKENVCDLITKLTLLLSKS